MDGLLAEAFDPNARSIAIATAIARADASQLDALAFGGNGGPSAIHNHCYRSGWCAVGWQRQVVAPSWLPLDEGATSNRLHCTRGVLGAAEVAELLTLRACFDRCAAEPEARCKAIGVEWSAGGRAVSGEPLLRCSLLEELSASQCDSSFSGGSEEGSRGSSRHSTFLLDAPRRTQLLYGLSAASGLLPAVEYDAHGEWWSAEAWPGYDDPGLQGLIDALEATASLGALSLLVPLSTGSIAHHAFARYDARVSGNLSIVAANLNDHSSTIHINLAQLSSDFLGTELTNLVTGTLTPPLAESYEVEVPAYGMVLMGELQMGKWSRHSATNCYLGHGARYSPTSSGEMPLGSCLLACLCDSRCDSVTVGWSRTVDTVECYKRGDVILERCLGGEDSGGYSTLVRV